LRDTDRQKFAAICEFYLGKAKHVGQDAALMAGYGKKDPKSAARIASKVLKLPGSKEYMSWLWEEAKVKDHTMDVGWALKELRKLYDYCVLDGKGEFKKKDIDTEASRKLLDQIEKTLGIYITKIEHTITVKEVQVYVVRIIDIVKQEVHNLVEAE
jgi:hypothetical protein